jgi:hypothetical protein
MKKYKIKSWYNDLGITVYQPYKKRWHRFYTSIGHASGNLIYVKNMIRSDAQMENKPKLKTIYYTVEVNNDAIKLEEVIN